MKEVDHNHPCNTAEGEVIKSLGRMKLKMKTSLNKPAQVYAEEIQYLSTNARCHLPDEETIKRTLRNQRSSDCPITPNSLRDLKTEGIYF